LRDAFACDFGPPRSNRAGRAARHQCRALGFGRQL